jgi:hypothetical protein
LDSNEDGFWDTGEPIGTKQGSNFDWEIKGGTTTDSWEVVVCGLDPDKDYSNLDLKVSHFCEGTGGLEEAKFRITKNIAGTLDNPVTFEFNISPAPSGVTLPVQLVVPAGTNPNKTSDWITVPVEDPPKQYTITEVSKSGWKLDSKINDVFTIDTDGQQETATFTNSEEEAKLYKLEVTKSTDTNVPDGTEFGFNLTGPDTNVNGTITAGNGGSGTYTFTNLKAGEYTITETSPTGYDTWVSLDPDPLNSGTSGKSIGFTIPDDVIENATTDTVYVYFYNDPSDEEPELGTIAVKKVDQAGNMLTGAGFTLYNSDKSAEVRAEQMVDAAGKVAFRKLPMGTYIVSETTVPGGHSKMADRTIVINEDDLGTIIGITAVNTKNPPPPGEEVQVEALTGEVEVQALTGEIEVLAFTGYNTIYYILGFLLILIGGIGSVYLTRTVRRKEE